ncbi:MAG: hypothetical protein A2096_09215 [Spirochaetes bacterium GWF1_41_5]|nr:MAG: hypothetical protein A2096_09215 [Spirochaetes bacterium GWF1_41_5]
MSGGTPETMKIIKPPAPLEYTEVTEPVAQPYGLRLRYFSVYSVLSRAQPGWLNFIFIGETNSQS